MTSPELARIIEEASGIEAEALTPEAKLSELGISSLAMIEIAVRVEDALGIRIDDDVVYNLKTVGDLSEYVRTHADAPESE
ncbi:acyl carrier protein [Corynebacterium sp. YIM 101645]|uniref:Acyl carrier protein n=1 Tax=Corynebacterium lemuris TaxID=1859292 RepID=A0ABT2FZM5_9CORY|nr:acyl carrier protein [Corynebacterium lemuris]MCS5480707.1 acyl carrier protein [Corynebacterium lemuris]